MTYGFAIDFFLQFMRPLFPYTFDPVFSPLLTVGSPATGAILTIVVVSVALAGILSLLYYALMDLEKYQEIKDRREELNEKMGDSEDEDEMEQAKEHMSEMKELTMENMKVMMKPMLVSMVVFFLVLPWMYTTFIPVTQLSQSGGAYTGELVFNGRSVPVEAVNGTKPSVVIDGENYTVGDSYMMKDLPWKVKAIDMEQGYVRFAAEIIQLPVSLPIFGDELGWLGSYILIIIPFNLIFRKLLGIQ
ncbi:MAG: EMC3/TMCO1 family protein [Candidatus Nanohaloarchaea archaeon]|nr:EMC3/TMCO1 family protein [Candidatus Nanohaloarchaea archaeon]